MSTTRRRVVQGLAAGGLALSLPAMARGQRTITPGAMTTAGHEAVIGPRKVISTAGIVRDGDALMGRGVCTLSAKEGAPALVILDYGRIVGGLPVFEVAAVSGRPQLTSIYAQALPWLLPDGDGPAPGKPGSTAAATKEVSFVGFAGGANLSRVERIALRHGRIVNRLIQGGQRFQALRLSGVGSVSLRRVGFVPTFRLPNRSSRPGRFDCSDPALSEIWELGAYALDVASLPIGAIPALWDIGSEGATVYGDTYTGYQSGLDWTDYTARFDVRIEAHEASWLVRAQPPDGIRFVLCAEGDRLPKSTPNTLRAYVQFTQQLIAAFRLPRPLREREWHTVETVVRGATVEVFLDGSRIAVLSIPVEGGFWGSTAAGWVALANAGGAIATFRDLEVTAPDGATLLRTSLQEASILDEFVAGPNTVPTIVDGATRDRLLFTGDLAVAARTLLHTSFDLAYLKGSIGLFSRYQGAEGAIPTSVPPQANPRRTPGNAFTPGIPDYTVHHVTTIYTYWWHTGDGEFLREQWPVIRRVLRYLEDNIEPSTGLFAPPRAGRVPEALANTHYYGALRQAAEMAAALGQGPEEQALAAAAVRLKAAINRHLFNPASGLYGATAQDLDTVVEQANAYAVLYRVADEKRVKGILERLRATLHSEAGPIRSTAPDGRVICPYTAGYDLEARLDAGDAVGALEIIRSAWRPMRSGAPFYSGATWEYVNLQGTPGLGTGTSLAHPWSSGPTAALSAYVLGARPLEPGFGIWLVEPQIADLKWARGAVPTARGLLTVHWVRGGRKLIVRLRAPRGTRGYVGVPGTGKALIEVDGRPYAATAHPPGRAREGYAYVGPLPGGVHEVTVARII